MADDSVEQKLSMSLDDLARKGRKSRPQQNMQQKGFGPQRHHGEQGPMSNWPWRGQGAGPQQQQQQQPRMHAGGGFNDNRGPGRHNRGPPMGPQHAPQWQEPFQQQGPYQQQQRGSVFARLGAVNPGEQFDMQQQHNAQQPRYQQHRQQQQQRQPRYQQQQQQTQQQRPMQPPARPVKPNLECVEEPAGHASLYHEGHVIIQVNPAGDMVLDSGDNHSAERRAAFNIALSHFNIAIREAPTPAGSDAQPSWSVSEGHRLTRFTDGMRIASRGPLTANRAAVLLAAYGENSGEAQAAAEAAQEASRKAAIAAGLLPEGVANGGAAAEGEEAARIRRLKAQGRFMPY